MDDENLTILSIHIDRRWPFLHLERSPREAWNEAMQVRQRDGESDETYQERRELQKSAAELREATYELRALWNRPSGRAAVLVLVALLLTIGCAMLYAVIALVWR